ncbi:MULTISPECIES: hypothetical protein [unclassified Bifidobacterium]|uniref:hypothetical protein n=1 Tax=unclassified Bifidobacterium TaxID=2608897 RepID=UPI0023F7193C|nr:MULTISPECIES: hypothetical protein [unclassified Bifidobacterium]WEV66432.1 hypothetical protein OZX71_03580 [Bifidobacterium sp. ESL0764]WEV76289.1 hypothetical protein OZX75_03660 [Bifidobacterium sp. ESL0800]
MADYKPEGLITMPTGLIVAFICSFGVAVILVIAILVLSRPRKETPAKVHGAHSPQNDKTAWRKRINGIVEQHAQGEKTRDEALQALAQVARDFAGVKTNKDISSYTLADLNHIPVSASSDPGMKLLRQTISALYPPEFADVERHAQARDISVEQAAEWVSNLIERWRK